MAYEWNYERDKDPTEGEGRKLVACALDFIADLGKFKQDVKDYNVTLEGVSSSPQLSKIMGRKGTRLTQQLAETKEQIDWTLDSLKEMTSDYSRGLPNPPSRL